jgi:transcriptional regulator with XRE-family HTH domain
MNNNMTKKAARLGISTSYLSMIYNGRRKPGYYLVQRWRTEALICKTISWWESATLDQIQKTIDSIR